MRLQRALCCLSIWDTHVFGPFLYGIQGQGQRQCCIHRALCLSCVLLHHPFPLPMYMYGLPKTAGFRSLFFVTRYRDLFGHQGGRGLGRTHPPVISIPDGINIATNVR